MTAPTAAVEPSFTRLAQTSLYWLDPAPAIAGFWSSTPATLGPTPTLTQTWSDAGGIYVVLGAVPADPNAFAAAVASYLAQFRPSPPRFLWIAAPDAPVVQWRVTELYVAGGNVARRGDFAFANYTLIVRGGAAIAPANTGAAGWGFQLADPPGLPACAFVTPVAQLPARAGSSVLAFAGPAAGCWRCAFDIAAPASSPPGPDAFDTLGCTLTYFTPDPDSDAPALPIPFAVLRQPLAPAPALALFATLDALAPFAPDRANLAFYAWDGSGTPPPLHSGFATALGYAVDLAPLAIGVASAAPARLAFASAPNGNYSLVPAGAFALTAFDPPGAATRILCGPSGLESLGVPQTGAALVFVPNMPAFAPLEPGTVAATALTARATTAWAYPATVGPTPATTPYFAQPEDSPFYQAPTTLRPRAAPADSVGFLDFMELIAADLPPFAGAGAFPMAPYRNLAAELRDAAATLEQLALAPRRRYAIDQLAAPRLRAAAPYDLPTATIGVSPHGLAIGVAADDETWTWLGIGQNAAGPLPQPDLGFTQIQGAFQQAMLTNNLFLVLGSAAALAPDGSIAYQLTPFLINVIKATPDGKTWGTPFWTAVTTFFQAQGYKVYATQTLFNNALVAAVSTITADQQLVFRRHAGLLAPVIAGWTFRLTPDAWTAGTSTVPSPRPNTYVIFKLGLGRTLRALVGDLATWAWPAAASPTGDPADAQRAIRELIARAVPTPDGPPPPIGSPYRHFAEVVDDENWTGILALNVDVPLESLPAPLQVLAAGIDPQRFYAHHLGLAVTPFAVTNGALAFTRTSMFGLIDYEAEQDQYYSSDIPFAFRVMQLTVEFESSVITSFTSRVELLVNRLFGAPLRLIPTDHGNNVMLRGVYQQQLQPDGTTHDTYTFSAGAANKFNSGQPVLDQIELLSTQLVTSQPADPATGSTQVTGTFQMTGNLRFYEPDDVDPFCWGPVVDADGNQTSDGYLRFGNLAVTMQFDLGDPAGTTTFAVEDGNLSFDLANSVARPNSLVSRFPVRLASLYAMDDPASALPADLGYVSISLPLDQSVMAPPWFGLHYTLDLGTLGALANSVGISLDVLAAWTPVVAKDAPPDTRAVFAGVKLPGTKEAFGVTLPLQGILQLGFRSIELLVDNTTAARSYTLRLRDFALRALGLSFPPGKNDIYLFGNPNQSSSTKLGWYAAYASERPGAGSGDNARAPRMARRRQIAAARALVRRGPR